MLDWGNVRDSLQSAEVEEEGEAEGLPGASEIALVEV